MRKCAKRVLHDAVLERMERNHREPAAGDEPARRHAEKRVEQSIPDIEARVKALTDQIKTIDASITTSSTDAERRSAERSKLRLRQEIEILQSRLAGARQGGSH